MARKNVAVFVSGLFIAVSSLAGVAMAETAVPAAAAPTVVEAPLPETSCLPASDKIPNDNLQSFLNNPNTTLSDNATGGLPLSSRIRELAGTSSSTFDKIKELTQSANSNQRAAIAAGLARVVEACGDVGSDAAQDYGAAIQNFVAGFGDPAFASTFQETSKEIKAASIGAGAGAFTGGGATNGSGDSQFVGGNKYASSGDSGRVTTSANYTIGSVNPYSSAARFISRTIQ